MIVHLPIGDAVFVPRASLARSERRGLNSSWLKSSHLLGGLDSSQLAAIYLELFLFPDRELIEPPSNFAEGRASRSLSGLVSQLGLADWLAVVRPAATDSGWQET